MKFQVRAWAEKTALGSWCTFAAARKHCDELAASDRGRCFTVLRRKRVHPSIWDGITPGWQVVYSRNAGAAA